jgi:hypothetical protein
MRRFATFCKIKKMQTKQNDAKGGNIFAKFKFSPRFSTLGFLHQSTPPRPLIKGLKPYGVVLAQCPTGSVADPECFIPDPGSGHFSIPYPD